MSDLPDRDKVRKAQEGLTIGVGSAVWAVADAYVDGRLVEVPVCQTCGGSERVPEPTEIGLITGVYYNRCPDCVRGYPLELVDRLAWAAYNANPTVLDMAEFKPFVVAFLDALTGRIE
jgi:hypothetical protein